MALERRSSYWIRFSNPCRDCVYKEGIYWGTCTIGAAEVLARVENSGGTDSDECSYVHPGWSAYRSTVKVERSNYCSWNECVD